MWWNSKHNITCAQCGAPFEVYGGSRRKFCGPACKQAAYRRRTRRVWRPYRKTAAPARRLTPPN